MLELPPPPDQYHGSPPKRARNSLIILVVIGVGVVGICSCGGLVGMLGFAFNVGANEIRQGVVTPWFESIRAEDYEAAAAQAGEGVSPDAVRNAVDRGIGLPLSEFTALSYPPPRVSVDGFSGRETYILAYKLKGSKREQTVQVTAERPGSGGWTIAIEDWGLTPTAPTRDDESVGETGESSPAEEPFEVQPESGPPDERPSGEGLMLPPADVE